jgi:hypothetical protein
MNMYVVQGAPNCAPVYPAFGPSYAPFPPHFAAHYPGIAARHMHPMMGSHLHHGSVPTAAAVPPQPHHHQCSSHLHHPSHVHTPGLYCHVMPLFYQMFITPVYELFEFILCDVIIY